MEKKFPLDFDAAPGNREPKNGFKYSGGKPPMDGIPPLVDVSYVKNKYLDIHYGPSDSQTLDVFLPEKGDGPFPLLIHIHGGGFAMGDKRDGHVKKLLECLDRGYAFASINYRLSDEAIFPAAVHDCRDSIRYLRKNASKYKIDPSRIATIGGSAGGNLSAMLAMNVPNGEFYGERGRDYQEQPFIKCAIDWFGPTDFGKMDEQALANGISFTDHNEPYSAESCYMGAPLPQADIKLIEAANPINYISERMCPIFIEHGTVDKLVPFAQSRLLYENIEGKLGQGHALFHALEGADHEDKMFESDENIALIYEFLEKYL